MTQVTAVAIVKAYARVACVVALGAVAACGRIGFGTGGPSDGGGSAADTAVDALTGDPSMVVHLTFDGADLRTDSSAAHHDATCANCPSAVAGRIGQGAAHFNGAQCLAIADAADLRPSAFTVAAWVSPDTAVTQNGNPLARPFNGATANTNTWEIVYDSSTTSAAVAVDSVVRSGAVAAGWQHVTITCDGASYTLYIAGAPVGTAAITTLPYAIDPLRIGCDFNTGVEATPYTGTIDDVRFYDRVLSAVEVQTLASQ